MTRSLVHGTAVRVGNAGVLLRGKPGAGKSSLALRLIDQPGYGLGDALVVTKLVADDQVELRLENGTIRMSPPVALAGQLEIWGLGIVALPYVSDVELRLVVDLGPVEYLNRMPEDIDRKVEILGIEVQRLHLSATDMAACAKVRAALAG